MRKFSMSGYSFNRHEKSWLVGTPSKYVVHDAVGESEEETKARTVAVFTVSDAHPADQQRMLAETLVKFLNAREEAMQKAIEDDALLQRLMQ